MSFAYVSKLIQKATSLKWFVQNAQIIAKLHSSVFAIKMIKAMKKRDEPLNGWLKLNFPAE